MRHRLPALLLATTLLTGLVGCSADDPSRGASAQTAGEAPLAKGRRPDVPAEWREQAATTKRRQKERRKNKDKRAHAHAEASARMAGSNYEIGRASCRERV